MVGSGGECRYDSTPRTGGVTTGCSGFDRLIERDPRLAPGILGTLGASDGLGQRCHRDIEHEQARRAVVEPLAHDLRRPGVLRVEGQRGVEVGEMASRR